MKPEKFPRHTDPATEEMASSRYALKIGDKEVLIVSDGVLPLPTTTLAHNADPTTRAGWFEMFLPSDALDWPLNVAVIRTGDHVILVDAGLGGQFPGFPRAGQFPQRLKHAGIPLSSVTDIVITGLGLAQIVTFVRSVGGGICVDSAVGVGTTFRLLLPCAARVDRPLDELRAVDAVARVAA